MSEHYAKFQMRGVILTAEVKIGQRSGRPYGRITIATGTAGHDFFVDIDDINNGKYKKGVEVKITGDVGREGFNPTLANETIEIVEPKGAKGQQQNTSSAA